MNRYKFANRLIALVLSAACAFSTISAAYSADQIKEDAVRLPIIMYHSILKDPAAQCDYVISPDLLESDFKYLKDNGYTTISMTQLFNYVYANKSLPDKPVLLTFDDGYLNNMTYALPLLEKYDMQAVIAVVGEYTDRYTETRDPNPSYAHFSWDDIADLAETGRVEFANHSYSMHKLGPRRGTMIQSNEDSAAYQKALSENLKCLQDEFYQNCGFCPNVFVYPYGIVCDEAQTVIRDLGFLASLSCMERVNVISHNPECLYNMGRFNRPSGTSTEKFMAKIK